MKWYGFDRTALKDDKGNWKGRRWNVDINEIGFKFNMNNISAAIGISNMNHSKKIVSAHKSNGKKYNELLTGNELIKPMKVRPNMDPAYWIYTVRLDDTVDRDAVIEYMKENSVGCDTVHVPNHPYTCFKGSLCDLPNAEKFGETQLCLPCGWWIKEHDVEEIVCYLIDAVNKNCGK
jgi:dTDP-4-amino-4,6-dideoxygalactose transaminase